MSTKQDIEKWNQGMALGLNGDYEQAERVFLSMDEHSARICFCLASCAVKQGKMYYAGKYLEDAVKKDPYLAVAYYQRGCYHLHERKHREALDDFLTALKQLRGNLLIDYKQLGLIYKLYSVEVLLNMAYALVKLGRESEAIERLQESYKASLESAEQRHQVVKSALDEAKRGGTFKPFKLPSSALFFKPPKTKTENMQKKDFLGHAIVVASVQDNDDFTGFLGAQGQVRSSEDRSPRVSPRSSPTPPSGKKYVVPKPSAPPPLPPLTKDKRSVSPAPPPIRRTSKPELPPPPPVLPRPPPPRPAGNNDEEDEIIVKVHYTTTRALVVERNASFKHLEEMTCEKFGRPLGSITLWYKWKGELTEITGERAFKQATSVALQGDRMELWAYDKEEEPQPNGQGKFVEALYDYEASQSGDLPFRSGDKIQIIKDLDAEWYVGTIHGQSGIFPKSYVQEL